MFTLATSTDKPYIYVYADESYAIECAKKIERDLNRMLNELLNKYNNLLVPIEGDCNPKSLDGAKYYSVSEPASPCEWVSSPKKKEHNMRYEQHSVAVNVTPATDPTVTEQRRHLINRLYQVTSEKRRTLRKLFKMDGNPAPKTVEELVRRIKNDEFKISKDYLAEKKSWEEYHDEDDDLEFEWFRPWSAIEWRTEKADKKGYAVASERLENEQTRVYDSIAIMSPEEGLKALREFENFDATVQ